jgi:APA family basic amino acid/polyamine antiporter
MASIWTRKSIAALQAEAEEPETQALVAHGKVPLSRTLSALNLVALGIGAIIGAGIFVLTGHAAAANAGPAITLSFATRRCLRRCRSPAAPTPMLTRPWAS